ncbi:potassium channel family protein [Geoalkalibacter halelectricus]|uniref:Trk system potassium uptake protein TrkA n=1 Tax=Geoalkalibacter halelectricus TaxID=2847045 RepID=A0ABY5ZHS0_9BACT|nr:NAD-binding protein [Geoalkalibacter halelectricus]MDO3377789.1 NAD-binding protein [Geoalkalibacter halelectricus]UWZ78618.1 NAD-binding protein [Geoalkalibacter halelectricus]
MKTFAAELAYFFRGQARKNIKILTFYCSFLTLLVMTYAALFRFLMWELEGRDYSFITGIYWTITAMSTLGYGDITFSSDPGFLFSAIVTLSGVVFMLILLPFGMISLFLAPWIEQRLRYRATMALPAETSGHILIFGFDSVTRTLTRHLQNRRTPFVIVSPDHEQAIALEEEGLQVVYGTPTDAKALRGARVEAAGHIIANLSDPENTNLCLTARSLCDTPIATLVNEPEHQDLLRLAGADQSIPLKNILGHYLASRATTRGALAHVLDSFGSLQIAEIPVQGTPFVGQTLAQAQVRQRTGLAVIGLWERGRFTTPQADTILSPKALMVLAGTAEQLKALEKVTGEEESEDRILILGHGRIGCAAASFLERRSVPFILIDCQSNPDCLDHVAVIGDATSPKVLRESGIQEAKGLIVTTNDDSTNIFLTLASRHINPDIRIVARANREENVEQLYAAGADFVVSNASVGANILSNIIEGKESIFLTEGINVFRRDLPPELIGKSIQDSRIRPRSGCSIVALERDDDQDPLVVPPPETILAKGMGLILIGSPEQEQVFSRTFRH